MLSPYEARVQSLRNYGYTNSEASFLAKQEMLQSYKEYEYSVYGLEDDYYDLDVDGYMSY